MMGNGYIDFIPYEHKNTEKLFSRIAKNNLAKSFWRMYERFKKQNKVSQDVFKSIVCFPW